jgi:hemerythrin superfamily protein
MSRGFGADSAALLRKGSGSNKTHGHDSKNGSDRARRAALVPITIVHSMLLFRPIRAERRLSWIDPERTAVPPSSVPKSAEARSEPDPEHCREPGSLQTSIRRSKMATTTEPKTSSRKSKQSNSDRLWDWGNSNSGVLIGAAVAGAAVGLAANMGRKLFVQMTSAAAGDWFDALKTEHEMTLAIFDKIETTDDSQTGQRTALLAKLKYALSKHAIQEEMVVYPALRQANHTSDADHLSEDHGYVKTYLYELETLPKDSPEWLARVRDFRQMIEGHMREEENDIFPRFRNMLSEEQNSRITAMMNKEGFKFA